MNNLINTKNLEIQTIENIKNSKSFNTNRAYRADYNQFKKFCDINKLKCLKPEVKTISIFLTDLSNKNYKYSTIKRKLVSISRGLADFRVKHPFIFQCDVNFSLF